MEGGWKDARGRSGARNGERGHGRVVGFQGQARGEQAVEREPATARHHQHEGEADDQQVVLEAFAALADASGPAQGEELGWSVEDKNTPVRPAKPLTLRR